MNYLDKIVSFLLPKIGVAQVVSDKSTLDPWSAYAGRFPDALKATKSDPNGDDNVTLPVVAQIVNASVGAMLGDGVKVDIQGDNEDEAQAFLDAFLLRSRQNTTLKRACLNGAVMGHVFVKLLVGSDGKPDRFQSLNTQSVSVETADRDCEKVVAYTISWEVYNQQTHRTDKYKEVTRANDAGFWTITESVDEGGRNAWREISRTEWPYEWPPVADCQNLVNAQGFYGLPDVTPAIIDQNRDLNTALSMCARLLRNHSHPKLIIAGHNSDLEWNTDNGISLGQNATATQLESSGAGAASLLELAKHLQDTIHVTSRTPAVASGKLESAGQLSGVALKILYGPLVQKVDEKRALMEEMLETLFIHVLELGGYERRSVEIVWPEVVPSSDTEARTNAQIDQQLGVVSKETIARQLGYDYETEQEQIAQEGADAGGAILNALNSGE